MLLDAARERAVTQSKRGIIGGIVAVDRYRFKASQIDSLPIGKHADGAGLYFYRLKGGSQWVYRYRINGRRKELGLGGYVSERDVKAGSVEGVSLARARKLMAEQKVVLDSGRDPITEKKAARRVAKELSMGADPALAEKCRLSLTFETPTCARVRARLGVLGKL